MRAAASTAAVPATGEIVPPGVGVRSGGQNGRHDGGPGGQDAGGPAPSRSANTGSATPSGSETVAAA